jgi:hypothetical protein
VRVADLLTDSGLIDTAGRGLTPWPPNLISSWSETGLVYTVDSLSVGVAVAGIRFQLLD